MKGFLARVRVVVNCLLALFYSNTQNLLRKRRQTTNLN